jgi:hypothetical protein
MRIKVKSIKMVKLLDQTTGANLPQVYVVFSFTNCVHLVCCICIKQNVVITIPRTVFDTYYVHQN